jgi:hypothetical protein
LLAVANNVCNVQQASFKEQLARLMLLRVRHRGNSSHAGTLVVGGCWHEIASSSLPLSPGGFCDPVLLFGGMMRTMTMTLARICKDRVGGVIVPYTNICESMGQTQALFAHAWQMLMKAASNDYLHWVHVLCEKVFGNFFKLFDSVEQLCCGISDVSHLERYRTNVFLAHPTKIRH